MRNDKNGTILKDPVEAKEIGLGDRHEKPNVEAVRAIIEKKSGPQLSFAFEMRPAPATTGYFVRSSKEAKDWIGPQVENQGRECFVVVYLNPKNEVIKHEVSSVGTADSSAVYPREILRNALLTDATALIFFHNHPSGDPEPSSCDREITKELVFASKLMGLKVLDHIIIGREGRYFSFADQGLIADYDLLYLSLRS
jgi:DNA repair protein RadC